MAEDDEAVGLNPRVGWAHVVGSSPNDGPVLRNALSPHVLVTCRADADYQNMYHMFARGGLARRPDAPCFGSRLRPDGSVGPYEWQTYAQVSARIDAVAAALWKLQLVPTAAQVERTHWPRLCACTVHSAQRMHSTRTADRFHTHQGGRIQCTAQCTVHRHSAQAPVWGEDLCMG